MKNHLKILFLFLAVSINLYSQYSDELAVELLEKSNVVQDSFFLSQRKIRIDSSILKMNDFKDSLTSNQLSSFESFIKQRGPQGEWKADAFKKSIMVPNKDFKKKIGKQYKRSVRNVEDNYWWKYRFDTLYTKESDSLMVHLENQGIVPSMFETVPRFYRYIIHISNPIISGDGKYAIIQIEKRSSAGYLEGIGDIYLFKRMNNSWTLILSRNIWVS
tara:strand:+ start:1449 stop:2099 length:651 start_codon:yes stop_codon:yes gene_type:complete